MFIMIMIVINVTKHLTTPGKLNLKHHIKSKHPNQMYSCKVCDYSYLGKNSRNLRAHEKTNATTGDERKLQNGAEPNMPLLSFGSSLRWFLSVEPKLTK